MGDLRSRLEALEAGAGSGDSAESSPPAAEALPAESGGAPPARRGSGGFAETIGPHLSDVDAIEPFLTLYGLALAGEELAR